MLPLGRGACRRRGRLAGLPEGGEGPGRCACRPPRPSRADQRGRTVAGAARRLPARRADGVAAPAPGGGRERRPQSALGPLPLRVGWTGVGRSRVRREAGRCVRGALPPFRRSRPHRRAPRLRPTSDRSVVLLREAIALARRVPVVVDRASAATWVAAGLGRPVSRVASVVFHSILMQYLADDEQERFVREVEEAGRRATEDAPLAWLRMEPGVDGAEVRLTTWPPGGDRLIAISGFHGKPVRWLAD
ncbi:MAG: DUF2332 family protein [Deltaproteobacteria bacterium]|nr:MAG: DUF2332 family protein [Deltaproteobacteria bacterium]